MARVRQARRCRARRKNGEPCKGWAMEGGFVCRMHGGASSRARHAAYVRRFEARVYREFNIEYNRWRGEWARWQVRRVLVTAELMDIPPEQVTPLAIGICRGLYDRPDGPEAEPKMRRDRRFRPVQPPIRKVPRKRRLASDRGKAGESAPSPPASRAPDHQVPPRRHTDWRNT